MLRFRAADSADGVQPRRGRREERLTILRGDVPAGEAGDVLQAPVGEAVADFVREDHGLEAARVERPRHDEGFGKEAVARAQEDLGRRTVRARHEVTV